jgi:chemotaxis response regulator CheB
MYMPGILIVDDHPLIRRSVRSLLCAHSLHVCGEAEDGDEAVEKAKELRPDIVVLDIQMPRMNGIEAAKKICSILPCTKILFLSNHPPSLFRNDTSWAHGFVLKAEADAELVPTLKRFLNGPSKYPWQDSVADAFASPLDSLLAKINVAERTIAARLIEPNMPDCEERIALNEALRALRQLISETQPSKAAGKKEDIA